MKEAGISAPDMPRGMSIDNLEGAMYDCDDIDLLGTYGGEPQRMSVDTNNRNSLLRMSAREPVDYDDRGRSTSLWESALGTPKSTRSTDARGEQKVVVINYADHHRMS